MSTKTRRIQKPFLSTINKILSIRNKISLALRFDDSRSLVRILPLSKQPQPVTNSLAVAHTAIPHCKYTIDLRALKGKELQRAVQKLVTTLFPELVTTHTFNLTRVSGAMTNAVYFVNVGSHRMLLRIYGIGCEQILDRDKELSWLSRLSQLSIGPRLLGTFGNGRFEEYLESTTLTRDDLRDPYTSAQIASRLYQLHSIVDTFPPSDNETLEVWQHIDKWYNSLESEIFPILNMDPGWAKEIEQKLNLAELHKDIESCKRLLNRLSTPTVFAHNDTQYGNILRTSETNELVVIDFEYAGYNPRGYDIANHFCEWMYNYHGDEPARMHLEDYPTVEEQMQFLTAYDQQHAVELLEEVELWKMACHLFWGLWGLVQASQSEIEFDYFGYAMQRFDIFRQELAKKIL